VTVTDRPQVAPDPPPAVGRPNRPPPGSAAGIEIHELAAAEPGAGPVSVTCADYSPSQVEIHEVADLDEFLAHHRPAWSSVRGSTSSVSRGST
jgi:magnesium transporter